MAALLREADEDEAFKNHHEEKTFQSAAATQTALKVLHSIMAGASPTGEGWWGSS